MCRIEKTDVSLAWEFVEIMGQQRRYTSDTERGVRGCAECTNLVEEIKCLIFVLQGWPLLGYTDALLPTVKLVNLKLAVKSTVGGVRFFSKLIGYRVLLFDSKLVR